MSTPTPIAFPFQACQGARQPELEAAGGPDTDLSSSAVVEQGAQEAPGLGDVVSRRTVMHVVCGVPVAGLVGLGAAASRSEASTAEEEEGDVSSASIDGTQAGWSALGAADFRNVNCAKDTWKWNGTQVHCTGNPVGVIASVKPYTNFELVCSWRHLRDAGNSGIFVWAPIASLERLKGPGLPEGIECQVLDPGYTAAYEKDHGAATWFTCHGDVFPVGSSTMKPFPPLSPNGRRSFPTANHTRETGHWNHYYVRAINGEVRLWVNGHEVSGGNACTPKTGYICLESEGSPIDFKDIRVRELP